VDFVVVAASVPGLREIVRFLEVVDYLGRRSLGDPDLPCDISKADGRVGSDGLASGSPLRDSSRLPFSTQLARELDGSPPRLDELTASDATAGRD
jgi:hypothetical protein